MNNKPEFDDLVLEYRREVFAYLWRMLGRNDLAEDCLQDVFLRAYKAYSRVRAGSNYRAWLYTIATNSAYSLRKREANIASRQVDLNEMALRSENTPHEDYELQERLERVAQAVMSLPRMQRAAIMLRKYQEFSYSEIATILECSEGSARANVYQGLKALRAKLSREVLKG